MKTLLLLLILSLCIGCHKEEEQPPHGIIMSEGNMRGLYNQVYGYWFVIRSSDGRKHFFKTENQDYIVYQVGDTI